MKFIYSSYKIGIEGAYRNPLFFKGVDKKATLVLTDDNNIKKFYEDAGVKVEPITKPKRKPKIKEAENPSD